MEAMIQVGTKFNQQTLARVELFARENGIVHNSSGKVNSAEAVRRLAEYALDALASCGYVLTDKGRTAIGQEQAQ